MDDLISRKAAIDALCAVCGKACDKSKFVYNAPQDEQVILCPEHYCLCTLPSAQPELRYTEEELRYSNTVANPAEIGRVGRQSRPLPQSEK